MDKINNFDIDGCKIMYHPERVAEWLEKGDCFPIYVEIGLTNRCNHRCIFCALDWIKRGRANIDKDIMMKTLEDMASNGVKSIMFAGEGEPLLHKDVCEFVGKAKQSGLDVSVTTNGVFFGKGKAEKLLPHLSWIRFSVDAGDRETYSRVHKTKKEDFDKVIENINYASMLKKKNHYAATIGVQALLISENLNTLEKLAEIVKEAGADNLQIKPYSHHPSSKNDLGVQPSKIFELEKKLKNIADENFKIIARTNATERIEKGIDYKECFGLPFFALVDSYGNVMPCNLYYNNKEFFYGNLNEKSFSEIWKSEKRKLVIEKIRERGIEGCRRGCRLDVINRYLKRLKNPSPHDNFI